MSKNWGKITIIYDSKFKQYYNIMFRHFTTNSDKITWYHYILLLLSIFTMVIRNSQCPQNATILQVGLETPISLEKLYIFF